MGDVLEFPSQQTQGLAFLERQLRELLLRKGADDALVDFATGQLTRIYRRISTQEQYGFAIELPEGLTREQCAALEADINAGLAGIRRENHGLLLELVAELLLTRVELFQQRRPD